MTFENFVRDVLEFAILVAVGATVLAAIGKLRRGEVEAQHCIRCSRTISRVYETCPRCGAAQVPR